MPPARVDPAGLTLARLWRDTYDYYRSIHWRYPEQAHTQPMLSLAAEARDFGLRALAYAGVPAGCLEIVFDLMGDA